jgi:methionyl-tRNA synthetase
MAKYLVTGALPYANGPLHFGHIAGAYLPADIFSRFRRLSGDEVLLICGTDEHGAPILINAEKEGMSPQAYTDKWHQAIAASFAALKIDFDNFSRTSQPRHHRRTRAFFEALDAKGYITSKSEDQLFCDHCVRGLPDRYVTGICPRPECGYEKARGDECPKCGFNIDATELKNPCCKTCGAAASLKPSEHWYIDLPKMRPLLEAWLATKRASWKSNVLGEIDKFMASLKPRAITRDLSWGVEFPRDPAKVFYVWFDAPIGYISSTEEWAERNGRGLAWLQWWTDPEVKLIHFIGKDNISFHTVIWPAVLMGQTTPVIEYILPEDVPANEFFNLEGRKFSTSEGWYLDIVDFLKTYPADALRWTLARSAPETRDSQFTWKDFQGRVNTELLGNFGNLASRVMKFIQVRFGGQVPAKTVFSAGEASALDEASQIYSEIAQAYARFSPKTAAELCLKLGSVANRLIDAEKPFSAFAQDPGRAGTTLHAAILLIERLAVALWPIIPGTAEALWSQLGLPGRPVDRGLKAGAEPEDPTGRALGEVTHLFNRIEDSAMEKEIAALKAKSEAASAPKVAEDSAPAPAAPAATAPTPAAAPAKTEEPPKPINFDHFAAVDLRVAKIAAAETIPKADKLLKLTLSLGSETRTVLSGIREHYKPEDVLGLDVLFLANLEPRKMRGIMSEGMVLMADGPDGKPVFLSPRSAVPAGAKLR